MSKKTTRTAKEKAVLTVSVILIILLILVFALRQLWYWKPFDDNQQGETFVPDDTTSESENDEPVDKSVNFLVAGLDESETLTDVILLVSYNDITKKAEILQIPRDSYVDENTPTGKINSIYKYGDTELAPIQRLEKVIYKTFKLKVDYYFVFTLEAFRNSVDAMGGIPINMPQKLVYDPSKIIPAGEQVLTGEQAEWLVRHRSSYVEGDIGRIKMQRLFLASAVARIKELSKTQLTMKVLPEIIKEISCDMSVKDIVNYIDEFYNINMNNIRIHMVPGEGTMHKGQAVWSIHSESTAELLNNYFRPDGVSIDVSKLSIKDIKNTGNWYENTDDDFEELLDGVKPGQKN